MTDQIAGLENASICMQIFHFTVPEFLIRHFPRLAFLGVVQSEANDSSVSFETLNSETAIFGPGNGSQALYQRC